MGPACNQSKAASQIPDVGTALLSRSVPTESPHVLLQAQLLSLTSPHHLQACCFGQLEAGSSDFTVALALVELQEYAINTMVIRHCGIQVKS